MPRSTIPHQRPSPRLKIDPSPLERRLLISSSLRFIVGLWLYREQRVESFNSRALCFVRYMRVDVHRCADLAMAELLHNNSDMDSTGNQEGRKAMPEIVK